ncbi:hypothetical protein J4731_19435 [Providencia rettgeri]|nr:hypothetical protein [Providencia rettgeri]
MQSKLAAYVIDGINNTTNNSNLVIDILYGVSIGTVILAFDLGVKYCVVFIATHYRNF